MKGDNSKSYPLKLYVVLLLIDSHRLYAVLFTSANDPATLKLTTMLPVQRKAVTCC
ncbi:hypothetical protein DPMN_079565 [Dreissena polymorpha]|uniref:Uncharacterized protein n=1 Tax=Dreissena polymorpha TaxID=45954 RepID=A0A9D4BQ65_DREPO|nr:hypothetical protein DPMN_079565 [Dreissena polymorpha]